MSLDQFVLSVHEKAFKSQDAIATAFRKNKSLDLCSMSAITNACKALDPHVHSVGHGCVLCDALLCSEHAAGHLAAVYQLPNCCPYNVLPSRWPPC